nr:hypothetical protein CFP56_12162 [Quercus suber]
MLELDLHETQHSFSADLEKLLYKANAKFIAFHCYKGIVLTKIRYHARNRPASSAERQQGLHKVTAQDNPYKTTVTRHVCDRAKAAPKMSNLDIGNDSFDPNTFDFEANGMELMDREFDDYLWLQSPEQAIDALQTPGYDAQQAQQFQQPQQQSQLFPYREQDAPREPSPEMEQAECDFTLTHNPDPGMEITEQTFPSLNDPMLYSQTYANRTGYGQMPPQQLRGSMTMPGPGVAQNQQPTRYSNRQLLDNQAFVGSTSHNQGFITPYNNVPAFGNPEEVHMPTGDVIYRACNTARQPSHGLLPFAQSVDMVTPSQSSLVEDQRRMRLADSPHSHITPSIIQTRGHGTHGPARHEIMRLRQEGVFGASLGHHQGIPADRNSVGGPLERSISPDRIVVAPRTASRQSTNTTGMLSRSRNQGLMPATSGPAVTTPLGPPGTSVIAKVEPQSPPSYTSSNIRSADDALRIAFRPVGERKLLNDTTTWRIVRDAHHAWAKNLFDVLLASSNEQPSTKLDDKSREMYEKQQERFMDKLKTLIVQQGKKSDAVLAQICANCYLQVEAVIVLHRDGVPILDVDDSATAKVTQRQKLDKDMDCVQRLHRMIAAVRDLKSIAYDVATGKNRHLFAYNPQGYINGKMGNIQSNATRKGRKEETVNTAITHGRPSQIDPSQIDPSRTEQQNVYPEAVIAPDRTPQVVSHPGSLRRRRSSSEDANFEVDDELLDPDYIDRPQPKRHRYGGALTGSVQTRIAKFKLPIPWPLNFAATARVLILVLGDILLGGPTPNVTPTALAWWAVRVSRDIDADLLYDVVKFAASWRRDLDLTSILRLLYRADFGRQWGSDRSWQRRRGRRHTDRCFLESTTMWQWPRRFSKTSDGGDGSGTLGVGTAY